MVCALPLQFGGKFNMAQHAQAALALLIRQEEDAVAKLEAELNASREFLRILRARMGGGIGVQARTVVITGTAPKSPGGPLALAVDRYMRIAPNGWVTASDVADGVRGAGHRFESKTPADILVYSVLSRGVKAGRYTRQKRGGKVSYRIAVAGAEMAKEATA